MAFTLDVSRQTARGQAEPFEVWNATGSAAMDETLVATAPMRLEAVYLNVAAGATAQNLAVDIYDAADAPVCSIQTKAMNAITDWPWLPNPRHFLAAGWYLKFTWANGGAKSYVLRVILTEN